MKKRMTSLLIAVSIAVQMFLTVMTPAAAQTAGIYGWTYNSSSDSSCSLDSSYFCSGETSVKLSVMSESGTAVLQTEFAAKKGQTYSISFWAKAVGAGSFSFTVAGSKHSLIPVMNSYDWTEFKFTYTHQEETAFVPVIFELKNGGEAYIDDVFAYTAEDTKRINVITNSRFEEEGEAYTSEELAENTQTDIAGFFSDITDKQSVPLLFKGNGGTDSIPKIILPGKMGTATMSGYNGEEDLSLQADFSYDEEYLYLNAVVTDDIHFQENEGSTYWRGDSIQLAMGTPQEDYGIEIGFYLTNDGEGRVYSAALEQTAWGAVEDKILKLREQTVCKAKREGNKTYYEVSIPWQIKFDYVPQNFLLNLIVNDNDGSGRKGYLEWNEGIGKTKSNESFAFMFPIENNSGVFSYIDGPKSVYEQTNQKYHLYIYNTSDKEKTVTALIDEKIKSDVVISAKSVYLLPFDIEAGDAGEKTISAKLTYDDISYNTTRNISVKKDLQKAFPEFRDNQLKQLKDLVGECREKGIMTDYEDITITTIESFIDYGLEDFSGGRQSRAIYVYDCLVDLYNDAKEKLEGYLNNTKEPQNARYYQTSDLEFKNQTIYADVLDKQTGKISHSPVFLSGYLDATRDSYDISRYGANMLQFEVPMSGYMGTADSVRGWRVNRQGGVDAEYSYSENSYKGDYSLKITNSSELKSNVYTNISQTISLEGGKRYTLSFYAKADSANGCSFRPDGWNTSKISISGTYDWKKYTYEYKPEEDCSVELMFMSEDVTGGLYLDNIRVVEKGENTNLVAHGSFEELPVVINGYSIDVDRFQTEVIAALDEAAKNNVAVDVLMSVHYFPQTLLPEEEWKSNQTGFIKYNIYNEKVQEMIEAFFRGLVPLMANHKALASICISNEPTYRAGLDQSNAPKWHEYLSGLYGSVDNMNSVWHESYASFEEVPLSTEYENQAIYYDYLRFNDEMFAAWHNKIAGIVKECAPDVPIHSKMMSVIEQAEAQGDNSPLVRGTNPEQFAQFSDMSGNDAWNFIDSSRTITVKNLWYDYLSSIKNIPVFNSEDHIVVDGDEKYTADYAPHYATDLWQGAIHGRSAMTMWKWARALETTSSASGNILHRPDAVALEGHTMLDLNRLAYEVEAIQNIKPQVAIMYSYPSRVYSQTHMNTVYKTYEALGNAGQKAKIITDSMISNGQLDDIKVLIIPNVVSVEPEIAAKIRQSIENGLKVIRVGECFLYDEHKNPLTDTQTISYIRDNSQFVDTSVESDQTHIAFQEDFNLVIRDSIKNINENFVEIIDNKTGANILNTEWCYTEYDGGLLLNLCSYERGTSRNIKILINGQPVSGAVELRSGNSLSTDFDINGYEPMLIKINN